MRARAPGKLVLSGSYAVLEGAPALVAAVDRFVVADSDKRATFVTEEVAAAIAAGHLARAPWFDADALRQDGRKLGLGSSAAILVASLAAVRLAAGGTEADLGRSLFPAALAAHRAAQGGGSGVDVAASCFGGVSLCRLKEGGELEVAPQALPPELVVETYACGGAASTAAMLAAVRVLKAREQRTHERIFTDLAQAAEAAIAARDAAALVAALGSQAAGLAALGREAGVPIVTPDVAVLDALARDERACMLPSGAGGGDIALYCGVSEPTAAWRGRAAELGLVRVPLALGARGVHAVHP